MAAREGVGLSDVQVERLREQLAGGGAPRVRVSGPQFADQPTGTVLAVGKPETDGDDFVTVRVKAGGVTDELRFSPRELAAVGRRTAAGASDRPPTASAKTASKRTAAKKTTPAAQPTTTPATKPTPPAKEAAPAKTSGRAAHAAPAEDAAGAEQAAVPHRASRSRKAAAAPPRGRDGGPAAAPVASGPAGRRRAASLPTVSVTLASAGATWSVSAQRGSRTVVKSAPIPPGVVSAVAEILGLPAVSDAVAAVNDAAVREAEARAAALRAELAALEAELHSHRRP